MRGFWRAILSAIVFFAPSSRFDVRAAETKGAIILGGGYFEPAPLQVLKKRFIELAGGSWTALVIIPTADARLEPAVRPGAPTTLANYEKTARAAFEPLGIQQITVLHTRDRKVANSEHFLAPLEKANCVWIPGGRLNLLKEAYSGTLLQQKLRSVLQRGGVVAGDSAGALVLGQILVSPNEPGKEATIDGQGFGLVRDVFLNVHANRFQPRAEDSLANFVSAHSNFLGISIDEQTAIVLRRNQITEIIGTGKVAVIDGHDYGATHFLWLSPADRYDLRTKVLIK
jgi:cyanophycinase